MSKVIHFLTQIRQYVRYQDGDSLRNWFLVDPEATEQYRELGRELHSQYRAKGLDKIIDNCLPEDQDVEEGQGTPWSSFNSFVKDFLAFWRDVDYNDLLAAHELLSSLVQ